MFASSLSLTASCARELVLCVSAFLLVVEPQRHVGRIRTCRQQPRSDKCAFVDVRVLCGSMCVLPRESRCVYVCVCVRDCVRVLFARPASRINFLWHTIDWSRWLSDPYRSRASSILCVLSLKGLVAQSGVTCSAVTLTLVSEKNLYLAQTS